MIPSVSVVMPVYGAERWVEAAVQSVLDQTHTDFELLVVDDGCLDRSIEIVEGFDDPRIRIIHQVNRGLPGARNTGIRQANGEYIGLIDADDIWQPTKLAAHVELLDAEPTVGITYSASRFIGEDDQPIGLVMEPKLRDVTVRDVICRNPIGNGSTAVARRKVFEDIAVQHERDGEIESHYFDESFPAAEDVELWTRIACTTAWEFAGIGDFLTDYRLVDGGISSGTEKHYTHWQRHLAKVHDYAPDVAAEYGELARAYQLRYYARRELKDGRPRSAARWMTQALRCSPRILIEEPARTVVTTGAIVAGMALPKPAMAQLMSLASR